MLKINAGFHVLRRLLSLAPTDFECGLLITDCDFQLTWAWREHYSYQGEIRCDTIAEAITRWGNISWREERNRAREQWQREVALR